MFQDKDPEWKTLGLIVLLLALIFFLVSRVDAQPVDNWVNRERIKRDVGWASASKLLSAFGQVGARAVLKIGYVTHDWASQDEKAKLYKELMAAYPESWATSLQYGVIELVTYATGPSRNDPYFLAHVFDNSPPHSRYLYSPKTKFIGYGIATTDDTTVILIMVGMRYR